MQRTALFSVAIAFCALGLLAPGAGPAAAQPSQSAARTMAPGAEPLVRQRVRPRTRLQVRPLYPYRRSNAIYPLPYDYEYPGPNARRECVDRYVTEYRPSGTVIVPRMRCWWVRG